MEFLVPTEGSKKKDDDINELLSLQTEFFNGNVKPAASCIRPNKNKRTASSNVKTTKHVTFPEKDCSQSDTQIEIEKHLKNKGLKPSNNPVLVGTIYERFTGFFDCPDRCVPFLNSGNTNSIFDDDVKEEGFPEVLDLSVYWTVEASSSTERDLKNVTIESNEKSLFARAFDELNALKNNKKNKTSRFKKSKQPVNLAEKLDEKAKARLTQKAAEKEAINNLEFFQDLCLEGITTDKYSRLAMDAVNLNFASKVMKSTLPRQEANIVRLFESLKAKPQRNSEVQKPSFELCDFSRSRLEEIKALYLEEIQIKADQTIWRFASDVNPVLNGAWTFIPIRRVLDFVQQRLNDQIATDDDVEICELALLWSVLILEERPSLFHLLLEPNEIFVRLAEVFLIGPKLFENEIVSKCVRLILTEFLFKKGQQNLLAFQLSTTIASLDAFMPFFEDLLKRYAEYSVGDENFTLVILSIAYMNSVLGDGLIFAQAIWAPERQLVRQMTISKKAALPILEHLKNRRKNKILEIEDQHYQSYSRLLAMYTAAISDENVTRDRNPAVFEIAAAELGDFVRRHTCGEKLQRLLNDSIKELDFLVDVIRQKIGDKIAF